MTGEEKRKQVDSREALQCAAGLRAAFLGGREGPEKERVSGDFVTWKRAPYPRISQRASSGESIKYKMRRLEDTP